MLKMVDLRRKELDSLKIPATDASLNVREEVLKAQTGPLSQGER